VSASEDIAVGRRRPGSEPTIGVIGGSGLYELLEPGTAVPLAAMARHGLDRLVLASSMVVHGEGRYRQENLVTSWARATGGRAAILRYHNVYGPRMPMGTPYAGVASLFRSALESGAAPRVFEDGRQRRDFVHVRDVASANLSAVEWTATQPAGSTRPFNVASGDVRHITASSQRIRSELGWSPAVSFEEGVAEFATAPLRPPVVGAA
jgi:dTDP-L-rhamnose 4-epimerase